MAGGSWETRPLPEPVTYVTGHNSEGKSIQLPQRAQKWGGFDNGGMPMATSYIADMPADLNNDADLTKNDKLLGGGAADALVSKGAALIRYVDLAPGYTCMMHRTQSLDYGICLAGTPECVMDSGEVQPMKPGDLMVQRYTLHAWRNPSKTEWARIIFVLMDCKPLSINGQALGEDLGRGASGLNSSKN